MRIDLGEETYELRKPEHKDASQLYVFKNDAEVSSKLGGHSQGMTTQEINNWIDFHNQRPDEAFWVITLKPEDLCIGHVAFYKIDYRVGSAEYGILIGDKNSWGKGLGTQITASVITYGFNELKLHRIYLEVLESNIRAVRLYEKLGFVREGLLRDAQFRNGQYLNIVCMGLLSREWRRNV